MSYIKVISVPENPFTRWEIESIDAEMSNLDLSRDKKITCSNCGVTHFDFNIKPYEKQA